MNTSNTPVPDRDLRPQQVASARRTVLVLAVVSATRYFAYGAYMMLGR